MKRLIALILFPFLLVPFEVKANDNFSVEIEALTLVMEQYKEDTESSGELDIEDIKPSYMALKQGQVIWLLNKTNAMQLLKLQKKQD